MGTREYSGMVELPSVLMVGVVTPLATPARTH